MSWRNNLALPGVLNPHVVLSLRAWGRGRVWERDLVSHHMSGIQDVPSSPHGVIGHSLLIIHCAQLSGGHHRLMCCYSSSDLNEKIPDAAHRLQHQTRIIKCTFCSWLDVAIQHGMRRARTHSISGDTVDDVLCCAVLCTTGPCCALGQAGGAYHHGPLRV